MLAGRYRYRVGKDNKPFEIGKGAFSQVYEGVDITNGMPVAIKVFNEGATKKSSPKQMRTQFQHIVDCFIKVHGPISQRSSSSTLEENSSPSFHSEGSMTDILSGDLVVNLIDYSRNEAGKPGASPQDSYQYFIVLELGLYTLDDYIYTRGQRKQGLTLDETRGIFWDLTRMVAVLHKKSLAHMDIKPQNIMRFGDGRWKLIDMDGALEASVEVSVADSECTFTPIYCAPELAHAILLKSTNLRISRLVDVWSLGMVLCDFLFLVPLLEATFFEKGEQAFLAWLSDREILLPPQVKTTCPDLHDLLQNRILVTDPARRWSLPQVLGHRFFDPVRRKLKNLKKLRGVMPSKSKPASRVIGLVSGQGVDFEAPDMIFIDKSNRKPNSACLIQ